MWVRLLQWVAVMLSTRRAELDPFRLTWNKEFAGYFDTALNYDSLYEHLQLHPDIDPHSLAENILIGPMAAGPGLRRDRTLSSRICELPHRRKRSASNGDDETAKGMRNNTMVLKDRHISMWGK
jgi:chitinase